MNVAIHPKLNLTGIFDGHIPIRFFSEYAVVRNDFPAGLPAIKK